MIQEETNKTLMREDLIWIMKPGNTQGLVDNGKS